MGNSKSKNKILATSAELSQPGQPRVRLANWRSSPVENEVSDEVVLNWSPCTKNDKGYEVEMWDLGLQEWVHVASTDGPELTLSNILSGILYRFRVTAITAEGGVSFPSDPSEPFVIDIPGVQIAPYWIQTPPTIVSLTVNQPLQLSAAALGTPAPNFHWYRDDEEIFIRPNLTIESTPDGSQLTILHVDPEDGGVYTCTAVNTIGKCSWETTVDLKAKPTFDEAAAFLKKPIAFQMDELMSLKVPLIAVPEPQLLLEKLDKDEVTVEAAFKSNENNDKDVRLSFRDNFAVIKMESAQKWHTGRWRLRATNPIGSAEVGLHFHVRSEPDPPPEAPEVEEISEESGTVTLTWLSNPEDEEIYGDIQYQVEYNRETWDIWLKGCLTKQLSCKLNDLFPGSYYRFRIRSVCKSGISEPSKATDRIFIGRPQEDELFGLPGGNYPKERPSMHGGKNLFQYGSGIKHSKRFSSLGQDLAKEAKAKITNEAVQQPPSSSQSKGAEDEDLMRKGRQFSLERDVYYFENNRREEVVNYEAGGNKGMGKKLGVLAAGKGLTPQEQAVFRSSMGDLCAKLLSASRPQLNAAASSEGSDKPVRNSSRPLLASNVEKPTFQEIVASPTRRKSSVASQRGLTPDEQAIYNKSLGDLCGKLMSASRGQLARKPSRGSVDNVLLQQRKPSNEAKRHAQPLQRYCSLDEATEREKEMIRTSLTQLCFRLKSVSRENSLAPRGSSLPPGAMASSRYSSSSSLGPSSPPPLAQLKQQLSLPDSYPSSREESVVSVKEINEEDRRKASEDEERMHSLVKGASTEAAAKLSNEEEDERPLMTSSPALSGYRNQPSQLRVASDHETTEDETEAAAAKEEGDDKFLEMQTKQRQNLLLSRPYFMSNKNQPPPHSTNDTDFKPTLSPINSSRTEKVPSPTNLSSSRTLMQESEAATLRGQTSIETDCSSRTLLGHNDTFDMSDVEDFSFDH